MAKKAVSANIPFHKHHYVRTIVSSIFGFIALALIIVSILVVWLGQTLTNTDQYVKTVSPLVSEPAIQDFVVNKASSTLLENDDAPVRDIAQELLGPDKVAGKTDDQLRTEITPKIEASVRSIVSSEQFAKLWQENNQAIHSELIAQLNSGAQTINLNFNPLVKGVINQLSGTELSFVKDKLEIKDDVGVVKLEGKQLDNVRSVYDYFKKAMLLVVVAAIFAALLSILISVHHLKTLRRIAVATGIFATLLAVLLSATSLVKINGADAEVAMVLANSVTQGLRTALIVIAIICLGGALGSKVYSRMNHKKSVVTKK